MDQKVTLKRTQTAKVLKVSNHNSASVAVERKFPHPKYAKIVKDHKRYLVHIPEDIVDLQVNNVVIIEETTPLSKSKSWKIKAIVK